MFGFFTTVAFCTAILTSLSVFVIPQNPSANIELRNVQVYVQSPQLWPKPGCNDVDNVCSRVKGRPHYYSPKKTEYAIIKFDLDAGPSYDTLNLPSPRIFI